MLIDNYELHIFIIYDYNDSLFLENVYNMKLLKSGVLLVFICVSCGFHLRGQNGDYKVNYHNLYIACNNNNIEVCKLLKNTVVNQNLTSIATNNVQADYRLDLTGVQTNKNPISLNQYGRISAYKLTYTVTLKVFDKKNKQVFGDRVISFSRVMNYNDSLVLSSQAQEQSTWEDIYQNVVDIILHDLTRASL